MATPKIQCTHHWVVESPNGPWSLAFCKKCGEKDAYPNSLDGSLWTTKEKRQSLVKITGKVSKKEFLKEVKKTTKAIKVDGKYTNEFKCQAVKEAKLYGRKFVRAKYNLPETTLRGWVKQQRRIKDEKRRVLEST